MKDELRQENASLREEIVGLKTLVDSLQIEVQSHIKKVSIYQEGRHLSQTRSAKYLHNNSYWQQEFANGGVR